MTMFLLLFESPAFRLVGLTLLPICLYLWARPMELGTFAGRFIALTLTTFVLTVTLLFVQSALFTVLFFEANRPPFEIFIQLSILLVSAYTICLAAHLTMSDHFDLRIPQRVLLHVLVLIVVVFVLMLVLSAALGYLSAALPAVLLRLVTQATLLTLVFVAAMALFREHYAEPESAKP